MTAVADNVAQLDAQDSQFVERMEALEGKRAQVKVAGSDELYDGKIKQASDGKDGERRFQIGRRIVTASTITNVVEADAASAPEAPAQDPVRAQVEGAAQATRERQAAEAVAKPPAEKVTLTSGKEATGKTLTIRCAWVDPDKRTAAQQKLFDTGFAGVEPGKAYEAMVKAAGKGAKAEAAMPDGTERMIKVQDAFQVRFSVENQKRHRNELRRRKATAKKAAREAAKATKA
jgi:hypothetical protein